MKISARACGGFAGLDRSWEIDTAHAPDGAALEQLLGRINLSTADPVAAVGADLPRWDLAIDDGQRCHTLSMVDDGSVNEWRQLFDYLLRSA